MRKLWIFNPDNDMALADGGANYMPPAIIRRMADDLAVLPAWMANRGDAVLASSAYNLSFLQKMRETVDAEISLITPPELPDINDSFVPSPWGWSISMRRRLISNGMSEALLPTDEMLEEIRRVSARNTAVMLLPELRRLGHTCGESVSLTDMDMCRSFVEQHGLSLLKAPLSSSGKGLNWCRGEFTPRIEGWCRQIMERQHCVIGEPAYDKVCDFAMEFEVTCGEPRFIGYSMFTTSKSGAYEGNLLMSDVMIEQTLCRYVPEDSVRSIREALPQLLKEHIGAYSGFMGVDMMVCRAEGGDDEPQYLIHPCVEVNMRTNMGILANRIYNRYVENGAQGVFGIAYHPKPGMALEEHERLSAMHPAVINGGRVASGYLPLTPVSKNSLYRAYIIIR